MADVWQVRGVNGEKGEHRNGSEPHMAFADWISWLYFQVLSPWEINFIFIASLLPDD